MKSNLRFFCCLKVCCCLAFLLVGALHHSASATESATYALKITRSGTGQKWFDTLRLYNSKTQKTVWTRQSRADDWIIEWSKDKRAVAIFLRWDYKILVWRLGYKTRFFEVPKRNDYVMGFLWSPDKRQLLIRAGRSGMDMTLMSNLYCLNIQKRRLYLVYGGASAEVWASSREVLYKVPVYDPKARELVDPPKFRVWRSP